jgi:hypothetical protein
MSKTSLAGEALPNTEGTDEHQSFRPSRPSSETLSYGPWSPTADRIFACVTWPGGAR